MGLQVLVVPMQPLPQHPAPLAHCKAAARSQQRADGPVHAGNCCVRVGCQNEPVAQAAPKAQLQMEAMQDRGDSWVTCCCGSSMHWRQQAAHTHSSAGQHGRQNAPNRLPRRDNGRGPPTHWQQHGHWDRCEVPDCGEPKVHQEDGCGCGRAKHRQDPQCQQQAVATVQVEMVDAPAVSDCLGRGGQQRASSKG